MTITTTVTFYNDLHNTDATLRAKFNARCVCFTLTARQVMDCRRKLCPGKCCTQHVAGAVGYQDWILQPQPEGFYTVKPNLNELPGKGSPNKTKRATKSSASPKPADSMGHISYIVLQNTKYEVYTSGDSVFIAPAGNRLDGNGYRSGAVFMCLVADFTKGGKP